MAIFPVAAASPFSPLPSPRIPSRPRSLSIGPLPPSAAPSHPWLQPRSKEARRPGIWGRIQWVASMRPGNWGRIQWALSVWSCRPLAMCLGHGLRPRRRSIDQAGQELWPERGHTETSVERAGHWRELGAGRRRKRGAGQPAGAQ